MPPGGRFETSNLDRRVVWSSRMVMPEKSLPVFHEVHDDENIDQKYHEHGSREPAHQLIDLNRDKKYRFADRHPTGPTHSKNQAHSFYEREQTVKSGPSRNPKEIRRRDLPDLLGKLRKELPFRVDMDPMQDLAVIMDQIIIGQAVHS